MYDVSFTDANNGTAVGESGTIIRTTNGGVTFVEEEQIDEVPREFLLSQNYPNPFNPSIKIKFSLAEESYVNLSIFNMLGKNVKELINEMMKSGYYEVELNASDFASGIYFYRIKAGDFISTKKMILMK